MGVTGRKFLYKNMPIKFGTKAETLETLSPLVKSAQILPQIRFTVDEVRKNLGVNVKLVCTSIRKPKRL